MRNIESLLNIMKTLRDPDKGCPWDLEQTFASIAPYTIEEAYEVADAIERQSLDELKDELGDLLLQVVFHAQMASEQSAFEFADVVESICLKMTRRHPHVFAPTEAKMSSQDVRKSWQDIKRQERNSQASVLEGVPRALPALKRAQKIGSRASSIGFDWPDSKGALEKVDEELAELKAAITSQSPSAIEEEMGDLLFSAVNVCRHSGIDAEAALGGAIAKFTERFDSVEKAVQRTPRELSLDEMEMLWQKAKTK